MSEELANVLANLPTYQPGTPNYQQLLNIIEEIGRDLRASYTFNKITTDRLKRNIINARVLVRGCLVDAENDKKKADIAIEKQRQQQAAEAAKQKNDSRSGSLCIIAVENDGISLEQEILTSAGVFRFEFRNPSTIIAALTDGNLVVQKFKEPISDDSIPVSSNMLLDVAVSDSSLTATSDNKGFAYIVDLNTAMIVSSWLAHTLPYMDNTGCEVWSCAIEKSGNLLATGGEDATMKIWDCRTKTSIGQCKLFDAGVVFVNFQESDENLILTGSYDEHVRLIDRRNLKSAVIDEKLGGGVWNIEKRENGDYIAACMYGGYAVLDKDLKIIRQNRDAGKNLLYGATFVSERALYCTFNDYLVVLDD
ncbi:unnamed protein product [Caenorhabditis bovis]|uniref:methylated diphthine methylhydrolase n=1 Tax=Caenorhabditis bovis TaxID=2654633 RepID=A0A8S1EVG1_9PELO|nr:unnamed protein product [Caenorhabditis bovis]